MRLGSLVAACAFLLSACTIGIVRLSDLTPETTPSATSEPSVNWNVSPVDMSDLTPEITPSATSEPSVNWHITTVDSGVGPAFAMVLDRYGRAHFAYEYGSNEFQLLYARWDGYNWEKERVADMELGGAISLILDSHDAPHLIYSACNPWGCIPQYVWHTEQGWNTRELPALASGTALQVDLNGTPHISYIHGNVKGRTALHYAYWGGDSWVTQTLTSHVGSATPRLQLDREGNPHICYLDQSDLVYTYWTGQEWRTWPVDDTWQIDPGYALALDKEGSAHLSYYDDENDVLKYAAWDRQLWTIQTVDTSGSGVSGNIAIAIDTTGTPHIVYKSDDAVRYVRQEGGLWLDEMVAANVHPSTGVFLALDTLQQPLIGFCDGNNSILYAHKVPTQ